MSLFNVFAISGSGMSAQSARLNLTASNLANSQSVATRPEDAYKARHPVFQSVMKNETAASVRAIGVVESNADTEARYSPGHPMALPLATPAGGAGAGEVGHGTRVRAPSGGAAQAPTA